IKNSGGHLKRISLNPYDRYYNEDNFYDNSLLFIRNIYKYCPSIEFLSLEFPSSKEHFTEFEKLLKVCQNLKSLLLIIDKVETTTNEEIGEELLKVLIRSAPTNLKELRFFNDFKFSLEALEAFLGKWRGRPALSILT